MLIEGKFSMKAPRQAVWDFLMEPGTLASCIPGAERMEALDDKTWEGVVKQKVGPISVKLKFTQTLMDIDPPKHIKAVGRGADVTKAGTFSQETVVDLKEISPNETEVVYTSKVSMVGRLATFGERIMRAKVKSVGEEFTRNLQEKLRSRLGG
jgi:carbon monoxide dehydrogenase subunit G